MSLDRMLLVQASGRAAEDAAAAGNPLLCGAQYDSTPRTLDDGDVGAIALDAAGRVIVAGAAADDAAVAGNPVQVGGRYDSTPRTLDDGDAGALALDSAGRAIVAGAAAEDAAVAGSPVQIGGRYDATDRTLDDGDAGAVAVDAAGRVKTLDEGGQEVTPLASAERTATTNSSDLTNPGARGVILTLDVTAITDTPSVTLSVTYKDPEGGNYEAIFSAAAAVTAVGVHT